MEKLLLKFEGIDSWNRPVYIDQTGRLFKNTSLRENEIQGLCTVYGGFDGEPDTPIEYTKYGKMVVEFI